MDVSQKDVVHRDRVQLGVVEAGVTLVRIALHREGEALVLVSLGLDGVLVAGAECSRGTGRPIAQPAELRAGARLRRAM